MKYLFSVLLFYSFLPNLIAQPDIRNANWGWSKERVKKSETLALFSDKNGLLYKGNLGGKKFYISYSFTDNKLSRVVYIYSETHSNDNNYITSYDELKEVLTTKYQEPRSTVTWKNDLFKDDEDKWGLAISAGHLALKSIWETENTNITLACAGENYEITLGIVYTGKSYFDLLKSERDKKNLNDF